MEGKKLPGVEALHEMPERARRPLVAANWKMHKTVAEAEAFLDALRRPRSASSAGSRSSICPPYTALARGGRARAGARRSRIAAQNMHEEESGAFTGEVSVPMLAELGVAGAIVGHSERRQLFGETDEALARKVPALLDAGLLPILCVGETEAERDARRDRGGAAAPARGRPRRRSTTARLAEVVIAYEPIWAIGTGRTATPEQAQEAIAFIRGLVAGRDAGRRRGDADPLRRLGEARQRRRAVRAAGRSTAAWSAAPASTPSDFLAICAAAA